MAWRGREQEREIEWVKVGQREWGVGELGRREWGNLDNQQHESLGMQCQKR